MRRVHRMRALPRLQDAGLGAVTVLAAIRLVLDGVVLIARAG